MSLKPVGDFYPNRSEHSPYFSIGRLANSGTSQKKEETLKKCHSNQNVGFVSYVCPNTLKRVAFDQKHKIIETKLFSAKTWYFNSILSPNCINLVKCTNQNMKRNLENTKYLPRKPIVWQEKETSDKKMFCMLVAIYKLANNWEGAILPLVQLANIILKEN